MIRVGITVEGPTEEEFITSEDINDNSETAPSKRLVRVFPNYSKRLHGPLVAARIGLPRIRPECPRFADWLDRVERLALQH